MSIRSWLTSKIRDDQKHAELDRREARTNEVVEALRKEREANGFGSLFQAAVTTHPYPKERRS